MKRIRLHAGIFLLNIGLYIMPIEAGASVRYNTEFLSR
jgi:hypothetical protein